MYSWSVAAPACRWSVCMAFASRRLTGNPPWIGLPRAAVPRSHRIFPASAAPRISPGHYTMEGYADAVARMLDAQGISRIVLVGGSMGGVVAQHFALRHLDRLERLLLVATGAFTTDPAAALAKADVLGERPMERGDRRVRRRGLLPSATIRRADGNGHAHRDGRVAIRSGGSGTFEREVEYVRPAWQHRRSRHDHSGSPRQGAHARTCGGYAEADGRLPCRRAAELRPHAAIGGAGCVSRPGAAVPDCAGRRSHGRPLATS